MQLGTIGHNTHQYRSIRISSTKISFQTQIAKIPHIFSGGSRWKSTEALAQLGGESEVSLAL